MPGLFHTGDQTPGLCAAQEALYCLGYTPSPPIIVIHSTVPCSSTPEMLAPEYNSTPTGRPFSIPFSSLAPSLWHSALQSQPL